MPAHDEPELPDELRDDEDDEFEELTDPELLKALETMSQGICPGCGATLIDASKGVGRRRRFECPGCGKYARHFTEREPVN